MKGGPRTLIIAHLDDEPVNLFFIPRTLHLRIMRDYDADATLEESIFEEGKIFEFRLTFSGRTGACLLKYVMYTTQATFLAHVSTESADFAHIVMAIFDVRIGNDFNAGISAYNSVSGRLVPRGEIEWLFLTAYPGTLQGQIGRNHNERCVAKPPNRVDLFNRIFSTLRTKF